jgi:hypothetical protein
LVLIDKNKTLRDLERERERGGEGRKREGCWEPEEKRAGDEREEGEIERERERAREEN